MQSSQSPDSTRRARPGRPLQRSAVHPATPLAAASPPCAPRWAALPAAVALALGAGLALPLQAQTAAPQQVEVVGTSPLAGLGVDRDTLPYASQVVRRGTLDAAQSDHLTDFLRRRASGMQVNDIQGSPLQADLTYRGYRASGLLGASQGLSVYLDGVRINEPFGDVVNWDMVPEFALGSLTVLPAANPSFGLNTLGGALALTTVNGLSAPGVQAELRFGSHGRRQAQAGLGQQHADGWHSWVGGSAFGEDGWRDHSKGEQALVMAKIGRQWGPTHWELSALGGRATLVGNGLVPAATHDDGEFTPDLYATRRSAVFSHPDRTRNTLGQLSFNASHKLDADSQAQALAYVRNSRRSTLNGDVADEAEDADENAALNTTATRQRGWGLAASLARRQGAHQWQLGATLDVARVSYSQHEQEGAFDASRGVLAGDEEAELSASVTGRSSNLGLYATDTWRLAPGTHLTTTLRYNRARVSNLLTTVDDDTGVLEAKPEERFTYTSVNPAVGLAQALGPTLTVFGNLARNTRVPTVIELGCADPEEPCRLPAGLQSDPYLKQVRATSLEAGLRWRPAAGQRLELTLFRNTNRDDIVFGSVSATGQLGYFQNFARTRHQGLDAGWESRHGPVSLLAGVSLLDATYQAHGVLRMGERNVLITPGTRMAGLPRQQARMGADWRLAPGWSVGADVQLLSSRGVQGNEDGLLEDGEDDIHRLRIGGYGILNLRASWQPRPGLELMLRVNNALDRRHETFGALAETVFDARGNYTGEERDALFVAPGAPRSVYAGLRLSF
ncbi:TonB-dependent receptor [Aquabacterium sp. OR-4]|uniref:TonB-dependent receptor n=1 Tax=Aquabacterium sp. OR-4 TaxID=2978127 RepID=UPI0028C8B517|nr:TonB-dependent receptor [Aquabacterium sp. OR-4]MDT7837179.1 TonB-dependent receptor [Aquabacterium sp. OR-4]